MSNPDKNPFEHTSDPDLDPPSNMDTAGQTVDGADLTRQAETAKKKNAAKTKVVLLVVGVFAAFALFQIGSTFFNSSPAPAPSAMKPVAPAAAPAISIPDPVPVVAQAPAPATPALSLPATPASTSGNGDGVSVSINGATPATNASAAPTLALDAPKSAASQPTASAALTLPAQPVPTVAKPSAPADTSQFAKQEDLSNLTRRVEVLETEVSGLKQLEGRIKNVEERGSSAVKSVVKRAYKPVVRGVVKDAPAKATPDIKDSRPGFWLDEGERKASTVQLSSSMKSAATPAAAFVSGNTASSDTVPEGNRRAPAAPYQLVAIMQDRAWVKQADGSMQTVQEGEVLPNGAKVLKIDPKKDEVRTSLGILR